MSKGAELDIKSTEVLLTGHNLQLVALALLLGVCALQIQPDLTTPVWSSSELLQFLPVCLLLFYRLTHRRVLLSFIIGYLWALLFAVLYLQHGLDDELVARDILIQGVVSGLSEVSDRSVRFNFEVSDYRFVEGKTETLVKRRMPTSLRLSWYYQNKRLQPGDRWQLLVRLKQPHGMQNPGGFDYEKWLYLQGVQATGYIRKSDKNTLLVSSAGSLSGLIDRSRQYLITLISKLPEQDFTGVLQALTVGNKSLITVDQWRVLRETGTSHLMAISGLHIGLVAGLVFGLVRRIVPAFVINTMSAPQLAAVFSLFSAFFYALLAGFTVPTQRAFVMLLVLMLAVLLKRPAFNLNTLALSLMAVLIVSPKAVLSAGFWLSYLAVLIIALVSSARVYGASNRVYNGLKNVRVQWLIALGLLPLSFILFQQGSVTSPVANMLVIPVVALVVVPLVLFASVLSVVSVSASLWVFGLASELLSWVWLLLEWLSLSQFSSLFRPQLPLLTVICGLMGVVLLLMPRGFPLRYAGLLLVAPMMFHQSVRPKQGEFWLSVLDVGQGLSVFIQTSDKTLLYDAGAKFSKVFDIGQRVIVPYFLYTDIQQVDRFIISHGDNDHAGGAESVLKEIRVVQVMQGEKVIDSKNVPQIPVSFCRSGDRWVWNGVHFEILHPGHEYKKSNNRSCVLKVWNKRHSVLLTGDIESGAESDMLMAVADKLPSDVIIVPHHGSNTSSSSRWLNKVNPRLAVISAGYKNRFKHPTSKVLSRYHEMEVMTLNTAIEGAIQLKFTLQQTAKPQKFLPAIVRQRKVDVHYWNHRFR